MTHNHWTIIAYAKELPNPQIPGSKFFDGIVEVSIDSDNEAEAIQQAKETIKRKYYRVTKVFKCEKDHDLENDMRILQMKQLQEYMKKMG